MPLIRLKDARPADVLAADVLDSGGVLLVAKGSALTPHILGQLSKRGVERLHVLSRGDELEDQSDEQRSAIRAAVEERFRWVAGDPFMRVLKEIVLRATVVEPDEDAETPPDDGDPGAGA